MAMTHSNKATVTLPSDTEILITREFDAPRHLVYRVWTTPELIKRWWSGKRGTVTLAAVDLRVGGKWRYVMVTESQVEVAFHGEFSEIVSDTKLVNTEVFEGYPDAGAVNVITFSESNGRTTLRCLVQHTSKAHRDMHVQSGMEAGMQESMDALEQVAQSLSSEVGQ